MVPRYTRGSVSLTGPRAKAWCLHINAEAPLSRGIGRKPGATVYTGKHLSRGGQGEALLVPPHTRGSVSFRHPVTRQTTSARPYLVELALVQRRHEETRALRRQLSLTHHPALRRWVAGLHLLRPAVEPLLEIVSKVGKRFLNL